MEKLTFVIEKKKDVHLLISIADKLGIKKYFVSETGLIKKDKNLAALYKTINAGVDTSNFGDASHWQTETRKDRKIK